MHALKHLCQFIRNDMAQDLAEYALLTTLISLVLIAALTLIGGRLRAIFTAVAGAF